MSRYIFSKNNRWYISEVFDPSDSKLQEKATYYTLTDDVTGPYCEVGTSDSVSIVVSYVPVVEPAGADVTLGVVDSQGRFQALRFEGTQASNSGSAIEVQNYKTWNSTLPVPQPSGGSMEFYKCSYVNSDSWGGYKAVQDPVTDVYSFEATATSGLTYSVITPVVGKVYADGALIAAQLWDGMPTSGMVFYAPLSAASATAETGQSWTQTNMSYSTVSGRACAVFSGSSFINPAITGLPTGNVDHTISMNLYITSDMDERQVYFISFGGYGTNEASTIAAYYGKWAWCFAGDWDYTDVAYPKNQWFNVVRKYTAADYKNELYVNGVKVAELTRECNINGSSFTIGSFLNDNTDESFIGNMCGLRIYDYALNAAEIAALAAEFTPTQA